METEITDKIEESVNTISGIDEPWSISSEGFAGHHRLPPRQTPTWPRRRSATTSTASCLPLKTIQQPRVDASIRRGARPEPRARANKPVRDNTGTRMVLRRQPESVNGVGQVLVLGGRQRHQHLVDATGCAR